MEVVTAEDALATLTQKNDSAGHASSGAKGRNTLQDHNTEVVTKVEDDAAELAMSTLSFQDYVRERMMRRRSESTANKPAAQSLPNDAAIRPRMPAQDRMSDAPAAFATSTAQPARKPQSPSHQSFEANQGIAQELHAMKELI